MRVLFIFLDGIGLGENDPETNPFARAKMPNLNRLLDGRSLFKDAAPFHGEHATLLAVDPAVGVIMVTGLQEEEIGRQAMRDGAFDYITKPLDLQYLEKSLWYKVTTMTL